MKEQFETYELKNGIRYIHLRKKSEVAHFALLVHTGTRDETKEEHGLAHFMEHMFFKGTEKKSPFQIISRLEDVGGEINAYTTKEETAIYSSFLKSDYRKAIELISDIFAHSTFPERERKKEAEVILSEIQSYEDTPSELIFDHSEELLFPNHAIGRNILGNKKSLQQFQTDLVEQFYLENYASHEIILCSVGDIPFRTLIPHIEKYFGALANKTRSRERKQPKPSSGIIKNLNRKTFQSHCILSGEAYSYHHKDRIGLHLLNNILGGPGMNSRLNMSLRERRGYSYSAESHYTAYTDCGALNIYFSCDKERFQASMEVTMSELKKLGEELISERKMNYARRQLLGQIAISSENNEHLMLSMAKSFLLFERVDSIADIAAKLEAIDAKKLRAIAHELLDPDRLNLLIYK